MNSPLKSVEIAKGVNFNSVVDERFKTNRISINFITMLDAEKATINAIVPNILKKGHKESPNFTSFNQELENLYGAFVAGYVQKVGDYQVLSLAVTSIDDKFSLENENITKSVSEILCKMALQPILENDVFVAKEIALEKTSLIDMIESEVNEKRVYAINNLIKLMCEGEPFGVPKYGYVEKVEAITPETAKQAYDKLVKNAKIEIMFTGCGDENSAIDVFKNAFSTVAREYETLPKISIHNKLMGNKEKEDKLAVSQSKMVLGFANNLSADDTMVTANKLMIALFGGTPSSKLFVNVREKLSLCYYCAARYDRFKGIMMVDCGVENQNIQKAREEILRQLDCIKNGEITDDEINSATLSLKNALNSVYDSDSAIENWYIGQVLSGTNISPIMEAEKLANIKKTDIIDSANKFTLDAVYVLTGNGVE